MFPTFPNFKKIELSDKDAIEELTKQYPPYNDFDFMSLWTYNSENKNAFSVLNNNLVIKIHDFITGDYFYSFLGINNVQDTITKLLIKSQEDHLESKLSLVPEINFKHDPSLHKYFFITEDPDNFDYILSVDEIADLAGSKYHDKRNLNKKFNSLYPNHSAQILNLNEEKTKKDIKELFISWEQQKDKNREETLTELTAIEKLFDLVSLHNLTGVGVYLQNRLIGFCILHVVQNSFAILSFEKGDTTYKGIYECINHKAAKYLKTLGYKYINFEQDLGIPGLKKAKMLWRPLFFLKKFSVRDESSDKNQVQA